MGQNGDQRGSTEGKIHANVRGYQDGRLHGASAPALAASYQAGVTQGEAAAIAKAKTEDYPVGYNETLDRLLATDPTHQAHADISGSISQDPGSATPALDPVKKPLGNGTIPTFTAPTDPPYSVPVAPAPQVTLPNADFRYRSYPCSNLVLPEFEAPCRSQYDGTYSNNFKTTFSSTYTTAYQVAFNANVRAAYDAALGRSYGADYVAGQQTGSQNVGVLDGYASRLPTARTEQYAAGSRSTRSLHHSLCAGK